MSAETTSSLDSFIERLHPEQRDALWSAPLHERARKLASFLGEPEGDLLAKLGAALDLPVLAEIKALAKPTEVVPPRIIYEFQCLPVEPESVPGAADSPERIALVCVWPPKPEWDAWIFAATGCRPCWALGSGETVNQLITQKFGVGAGSLDSSGLEDLAEQKQEEEEDENAAIIRFVNEIIARAISDRATDIHFEPGRDILNIRYRIDGELVPVRVPDNLVAYQGAIISRIKIMAKLNISERRRPQDGRITFSGSPDEIDIRVSTLPTMYGESISLRLLSQKTQPLTMEDLGFAKEEKDLILPSLHRPHGIILVTGPTGSGKSTTLTAFIRHIRRPELRIITVEDPVEYEVEGINQTQVHAEIGLTFASSLRTILRQDPDVIMVGEIRDRETADIAIRASLTGHLVLSTLHTNDAPGALTRLTDMDIEPFLIASSVDLILAQRLVRRLCKHCAVPADYEVGYLGSCLVALDLDPALVAEGSALKKSVGCKLCRHLGYRGRVGIFEILRVGEEIHDLIIRRASARDIRKRALQHGMTTLQGSGWKQAVRGLTSLNEIMEFANIGDGENAPTV